ncbi:MAG TPA: nitroreductase family deazaflavin-dependent oxidoreductase [Pseudonocardiaceae bacterium]
MLTQDGRASRTTPTQERAGRWLRESSPGLAVLAVLIGAGAGLGAIAFRWLIATFTWLFSGHADYSAAGHAAHPWLPALGPWFVLAAPVLAGLVYGPLMDRFAPEARGHGVPEVMYAVARRSGRIPGQVSVVKALASALCIGGGGSVGREGPIVQIGSALGSAFGRRFRLAEPRLRILVACGAAGGIAATFNAPMTGPIFAMELILGSFAVEAFGAVALSSVTASVVGRAVLGDEVFLRLPGARLHHPAEYLLVALLGVLVGGVGVLFIRVLYRVEDVCDWAWRGPEWLRPGIGGLLLGTLLLVLPELYGVGYPVLRGAVEGRYLLGFLLILLVGKLIATSLTIGIGGSGGVFAPSLFLGAMAGTAFGVVVHHLLPSATTSPAAYGVIGMGAAFAGAARAPITAIVVLFELTGQYSLILPLMTAVVIATLVSQALSRDTIYTGKLRRRGIDLDAPREQGPLLNSGAHGGGTNARPAERTAMKELARPARPSRLRRLAFRLPITFYRLRMGWLLGQRFVLVAHRGRRSGRWHQTVLEVIDHDQQTCTVAAGFGTASDWYRNLRQTPDTLIQIGTRQRSVTAVPLTSEQGGALMARYAPRHPLVAPRLCRFMGFEVDGSDHDYREVGQRIPFLRFEPRTSPVGPGQQTTGGRHG